MAVSVGSPIVAPPHSDHGGRGFEPPVIGYGGDRGGDNYHNYRDRLRRARFGLALVIVAVVTLFVALTVVYVARRESSVLDPGHGIYVRTWVPVSLPITLLWFNTFILLLSSISVDQARRQLARRVAIAQVKSIPGVSLGNERSFPWLGLTVTLGLMFLAGQWMAWRQLAIHGFTVSASASSSFVYLLTAAHAIHLMGGLAVLFYAAAISSLRKPIESRMIMLDVTALYWHVMLALWIYVFALLWIGR